ncbi:MAG: hypothetical protein HY769_09660 [Candidatus Stahlbacteria bacterium]|nr:hypothetical protein [Candidatus Stahlbacteria bacterium]
MKLSKENSISLAEQVILSKDKIPVAVIMPIDEYNSLRETAEIMSDTELVVGIMRANKDIRKGRTYPLREVFDAKGKVRCRSHR